MRSFIKYIALILAVCISAAALAACSGGQSSSDTQSQTSGSDSSVSSQPGSSSSDPAQALAAFNQVLGYIGELQLGVAGASMQAYQRAVSLLDWTVDYSLTADEMKAAAESWYDAIAEESKPLVSLQLAALRGGADAVLDEATGKDALDSIGNPQTHDVKEYSREAFDAVVDAIADVSATRGFTALLGSIKALEVGTAGSSLKAAQVAVALLEWAEENTLADDTQRTMAADWYATLTDEEKTMLPEQLDALSGAVESVTGEHAADMLESIGNPQMHSEYTDGLAAAVLANINSVIAK